MWTKVLALQKCMVYIGLFHPCEHRANISDKDQGIELAFSIALADPNFLTTQRLSAFAQCPQLPEASRRSTGVKVPVAECMSIVPHIKSLPTYRVLQKKCLHNCKCESAV